LHRIVDLDVLRDELVETVELVRVAVRQVSTINVTRS